MSRRATSAGHRADVVGVSDNYAGLIEEVRQVNRQTPVPATPPNPIVAKISDIGRSTVGAGEDVTTFLQMLGSLCIAILGVLRRPRSLRLTSLTYQFYRVCWQAIPIVVLITFLIGAKIAFAIVVIVGDGLKAHRPALGAMVPRQIAAGPFRNMREGGGLPP